MGEENSMLAAMISELNRGTLVLSVLSQTGEPRYGYALVQIMEEKGVAIDPNTLYPLMRRLEKQGLLKSEWITDGPKPRKFYRRTPEGDRIFLELKKQWQQINSGINLLLREEE